MSPFDYVKQSYQFHLQTFYAEKKIDWGQVLAVGLLLGLVLACGTFFGYNNLSSFTHPSHYYA